MLGLRVCVCVCVCAEAVVFKCVVSIRLNTGLLAIQNCLEMHTLFLIS